MFTQARFTNVVHLYTENGSMQTKEQFVLELQIQTKVDKLPTAKHFSICKLGMMDYDAFKLLG